MPARHVSADKHDKAVLSGLENKVEGVHGCVGKNICQQWQNKTFSLAAVRV